MIGFLFKTVMLSVCLTLSGLVGYACYDHVRDSLDYQVEWTTVLMDSQSGQIRRMSMAPVGIEGDSVIFMDSQNNKILYNGDFVSSKADTKIQSDNALGRLVLSRLGTNSCRWIVRDRIDAVNGMVSAQEKFSTSVLRLRALTQKRDDLSAQIAGLDTGDETMQQEAFAREAQGSLKKQVAALDQEIISLRTQMKTIQSEIASAKISR